LEENRTQLLMSRLAELGAVEPRLAKWGSSGQLYRFSCRVSLDKAPKATRHFESVAAEPVAAVEDVIASVGAWRTAEGGATYLP
jgi:hypothetical protein